MNAIFYKAWYKRLFGICLLSILGLCYVHIQVTFAQEQKFYAPKLNVEIPGLKFSDYPILRKTDSISIPFLGAYVTTAYKYLVGVSVIAAAIMIVYGGFKYIIGGKGLEVADAKKKIVDAVIGLLLILGSYTILNVLNPSTTLFPALEIKTIPRESYLSHVAMLDGVPLEKMKTWDRPPAPTGPSSAPGPIQSSQSGVPAPGVDKGGIGTGCVSGSYPIPQPKCNGRDACEALYCRTKDYTADGFPTPDQLVGFEDIFPATVGEQIDQKGITFVPPAFCGSSKGCNASKYLSTVLLGPKATLSQKARMGETMHFRPEVRDALIKAGQIAKSRGYFLAIGDGTRTMKTQALNWCQRIQESGSSKGMATPGNSPHQLGVAVDIGLFKLEDGKVRQLTLIGTLCQQVTIQQQLGVEHLKTLETIMSEAGFKHMCDEVWHFDFKGVYAIDCSECVFPGRMQERIDKDSSCKK